MCSTQGTDDDPELPFRKEERDLMASPVVCASLCTSAVSSGAWLEVELRSTATTAAAILLLVAPS